MNALLFRVAVPVKLDPDRLKDKLKAVPELVRVAVPPVIVSVLTTSQLELASRVWTPPALTFELE